MKGLNDAFNLQCAKSVEVLVDDIITRVEDEEEHSKQPNHTQVEPGVHNSRPKSCSTDS